jgi:hypothetical protein
MTKMDFSGMNLPHKLGSISLNFKFDKKRWDSKFLSNKAVGAVYGATLHKTNYADSTFNGDIKTVVPFLSCTREYANFINLFLRKFKPNSYTDYPGYFDAIVNYGYEIGKTGHPELIPYGTEEIFMAYFDDYEIAFTPYNDGIMLADITVTTSERGKGIATDVMNKIYDISEDNNIPIYLIPYPAEEFKSEKESELVNRLKNWYEKIGFGPISEGSKVWCNFE